ncbi:stalk domain-containing protein [Paenibacillus chartarius]|uniref:Stalk domain-containing protein n=1 Tax=Paenibacillus chartarius TaxID=747481 RepID=A0ABV6DU51_9BACL
MRYGKSRGRWRRMGAVAALSLALTLPAGGVAYGFDYDPFYWSEFKKAEDAAAAGNPAGAVSSWQYMLGKSVEVSDWNSAALFAMRLGTYFDSVKKYEEAIRYYEAENQYWLNLGLNWGAVHMARAEEIRTTLELYVSTTDEAVIRNMSASSSGGLAKFEPESGTYIGIYSEKDPGMENYFNRSQDIYGKNHAIYLAYAHMSAFPQGHADRAKEAGGALQIALEPIEGLGAVQDGPGLREWARAAKAAGIPIFLRFAGEMNGSWVTWHGDTATYIEKFRLVAKVMKEEAPNVAMVWSPNDTPRDTMSAYYPGDEYVDWVGVSLYTGPYDNGDPAKPTLGSSPVEKLDEVYRLYAGRKPIMISEGAITHTSNADGRSFTDWAVANLDRMYEVMPKKYPRLKAITYFNQDQGQYQPSSRSNYLLRDNEAMMSSYKEIISDPFYLTKVETGAKPAQPVGYVKADQSASFVKKVRIVPYVKIPDVQIGKVEYLLNGAVVRTQESAPFHIELGADEVGVDADFRVRVYNEANERIVEKPIRLSSDVSVNIDGTDYRFEQPPLIVDGSTLAPLRSIFEALGATVEWDADTMTATGKKGDTTVTLKLGESVATRNGRTVELSQPAQLINGRTMAPARFVGEAFGGQVTWDGTSRTVIIRTK